MKLVPDLGTAPTPLRRLWGGDAGIDQVVNPNLADLETLSLI